MPKRKAAVDPQLDEPSTSQTAPLSSVLYVGHLPHGFYEEQLKDFFTQFGTVTHVKVSRNKKTGKAKHYAFVEFQAPEVAAIAAEAMDGYMLFTQKLACSVMKAADVHKDLFKGTHRKFKTIPWQKIEERRHNKDRTQEEKERRLARAVSRDQKRQKLILAAGLDFTYQPLSLESKSKKEEAQDLKKAKKTPSKQVKNAKSSGKVEKVATKAGKKTTTGGAKGALGKKPKRAKVAV